MFDTTKQRSQAVTQGKGDGTHGTAPKHGAITGRGKTTTGRGKKLASKFGSMRHGKAKGKDVGPNYKMGY